MRAPSIAARRIPAIAAGLALIGVALLARAAFITPPLVIGQPIEAGPQMGVGIAAVWDGEAFMTVWSDDRSGQGGIYGARVAADGTLIDHPNLILVTDRTNLDYAAEAPALAFDGTNFLLAYRQNYQVQVRRLDRTGKVLDAKATRVTAVGNAGAPAVVFDGVNYLVVMRERVGDTSWNEIRATRVSTAGVALDTSSLTVRFSLVKDATLGDPVARASATGTMIAWTESPTATPGQSTILGTVIAGGVKPTQVMTPIPIATEAGMARGTVGVELDGAGFFVAWIEWAPASPTQDVRGRSVSAAAVLGTPVTLLPGVTFGGGGDLAADGQNWLVGWYEFGADKRPRATVARTDRAGALIQRTTLDDQGLMNTSGGLSFALGSGGGHALAAWRQQVGPRHIPHAAPVPAAGGAKPTPTRLSFALSKQTYPAMASDGQGYLVAWTETRDTGFTLLGARVDVQRGVLDGTGISIASGVFSPYGPAVASNGDGYLVAWASGSNALRARAVGADGQLRGAQEIAVFDGTTIQPHIGVTGGVYLIAWVCATSKICLSRVSAAGALLDTTPNEIAVGAVVGSAMRVSGSTGQFLLIWRDLQATGTRAARINPTTGAILDPTGTSLPAIGTEALGTVTGLASSGDQYMLVWDRTMGGIVAARLAPDLTWLDTAPIAFGHRQENSHIDLEDSPSVVWGGADYVVAWRNQVETIYAGDPKMEELDIGHVSPQGAIVSGGSLYSGVAGFLTSPLYDGPALAAGTGHFLVGQTVVDVSYGYKVSRNRAWLSSTAAGTCPTPLCNQPVMNLPDAGGVLPGGGTRDAGSSSEGGADAGGSAPTDAAPPPADGPIADAGTPTTDAPGDTNTTSSDGAKPLTAADGGDAGAPRPSGGGCSCSVGGASAPATPLSILLLLAIAVRRRRRRCGRHGVVAKARLEMPLSG